MKFSEWLRESELNEAKFKAPKDFKELQRRLKSGEIMQILDDAEGDIWYLDIEKSGDVFIVDENGKRIMGLQKIQNQVDFNASDLWNIDNWIIQK